MSLIELDQIEPCCCTLLVVDLLSVVKGCGIGRLGFLWLLSGKVFAQAQTRDVERLQAA